MQPVEELEAQCGDEIRENTKRLHAAKGEREDAYLANARANGVGGKVPEIAGKEADVTRIPCDEAAADSACFDR